MTLPASVNDLNAGLIRIPSLLKDLTAVVAVIVDEQGYVLESNRGFHFLVNQDKAPANKWNVRELFVQPGFSEFVNIVNDNPDEPVYQGILNIGDPAVGCRSITGSVYRHNQQLLVVGEYDIADLEHLSASVVELNDELTQTQRDLVRANRDLKRNEAKITRLMLTDPMTGIANRRHFDQRIKEEMERHKRHGIPLSFVMCDIDHFKSVNDNYGHDIGDIVICAFAHTLREHMRTNDFVARVGGEEFILILPHTTNEATYLVVDRMRKLFEANQYEQIERPITASFGVTILRPEDTVDCLIKRADQSLYEAKNSGRNRVIVHP